MIPFLIAGRAVSEQILYDVLFIGVAEHERKLETHLFVFRERNV